MKKLVYLLLLVLSSCEVYFTEISDLTLSGKYVISRIDVTSVDQNTTPDSLYSIGSTYFNNTLPHPFDSIEINRFYMYFDYSTMGFNLLGQTPDGRDIWQYRDIFYQVWNNNTFYHGTLIFDYIDIIGQSRRMIFSIEEDGLESLQLKSSGTWLNGEYGEKQIMTLYLTRVGP